MVPRKRLDELRRVFVLGRKAVVEEEDGRGDAVLFLERLDSVEEEGLRIRARVETTGIGRSALG